MTEKVLDIVAFGVPVAYSKRVVPIKLKTGKVTVKGIDADPKKAEHWREQLRERAYQQWDPLEKDPIVGAICLLIQFVRPKPSSWPKRGQSKDAVRRAFHYWPIKRPDCSNWLKSVEDCFSGIIWRDDSYIVLPAPLKLWGSEASSMKTYIEVHDVTRAEPEEFGTILHDWMVSAYSRGEMDTVS